MDSLGRTPARTGRGWWPKAMRGLAPCPDRALQKSNFPDFFSVAGPEGGEGGGEVGMVRGCSGPWRRPQAIGMLPIPLQTARPAACW